MTDEGRERWLLLNLAAAVTALTILLVLAIVGGQLRGEAAAAALGLAILVAAFETGALLGFLFSIPRVLARPASAAATEDADTRRLLLTNTNLERISDWLTTLLVGAGLTQLARVPEGLAQFSTFVASAMPPAAPGAAMLAAMAPVILVAGLVLGFLMMYLYTRIEITRVLNIVEGSFDRSQQRMLKGAVRSIGDLADSNVPLAAAAAAAGLSTPEDAIDLMFDLLYRDKGYRMVIEIGEQLRTSSATAKADYWFYLAAAYGQQMTARQSHDDAEGAAKSREKALDAARRAVRIDKNYRERLWSISTPNTRDDDLSPLHDDRDFLKIVGRGEEAGA